MKTPEKIRASWKKWYYRNREKILEKQRNIVNTPKRISELNAYRKEYRQKNKIRHAISESYRRKRIGEPRHIYMERLKGMIEESTFCPLCGIEMSVYGVYPDGKTIDHILPLCIGGDNSVGNVRIVCFKCNVRRPKKHFSLTPER